MLVDNGTIVLALSGANMAIFRNLGKALHVELELLEEEEQQVPETAELGRDRPGRSFQRTGARRSGYETNDLHSQEEERFIRQSIARLDELATEQNSPAIVIATPTALGIARKFYSAGLLKLIAAEIHRDYSTRSAKDVAALLAGH